MPPPGDPLLFYGGAAACAAVAGRAALGTVSLLRERQARRRRSDDDAAAFRAEAHAAAEAARARLAKRLAWEGNRTLRVSAVVDESPGVKSLFLVDPKGRPLPRYLPGQYLTLTLPAGPGGGDVIRCYSLSDRPRPEYYRLTVRRQDAPADAPAIPPGIGSGWLHRHAVEGVELSVAAPRGAFFYHPAQPRPAVLIGAGVGVTPLVSMLEAIHHNRLPTPTHAVLGFRDGSSHLFADRVRELAATGPNLSATIAYSSPRESDRLGSHYHAEGRVSIELLRGVLPSNQFDYFVCGPPRMMQTLVPDLLAWGVPAEAIHYEAFGPASVSIEATSLREQAVGSPVRFSLEGDPVVWDGEHGSLLELAEASGVPVSSGCRAGNCGACRVRVVEGRVAAIREAGVTTPSDECLACISLPDGPVTIEA